MLTTASALRKDKRTRAQLQHRHFATIADIIRRMDDGAPWPVEDIQTHFADHLADTNPRFDRQRFLNACRG